MIVLQHVEQQRNDKTARNAFFIDVPRNEIVTVWLRSLSRFLFFFPLFLPRTSGFIARLCFGSWKSFRTSLPPRRNSKAQPFGRESVDRISRDIADEHRGSDHDAFPLGREIA